MQQTATTDPFYFLYDEGEMARLMRQKDWSQTPLGPANAWPQSLRTTLSIILRSRFPMFLFWGPELICFYNDAYRPSLGNTGKHPTALGERGETVWPDIWSTIKPLIDQVLAGGEATWSEDQLIPIYRNGQMEDVYWTFSYSPVDDESGQVAGVLVTCMETTQAVESRQQAAQSEQLLNAMIQQTPLGVAILLGSEFVIEQANPAICQIWGRRVEQVLGKPLLDALPETAGQGFEELLADVRRTGQSFTGTETLAVIHRNGRAESVYVDFTYEPLRSPDGRVERVMVVAEDVTVRMLARQKVEESEARFQSMAEDTDILIAMSNEAAQSVYLNRAWADLTGRSVTELMNLGWVDLVHPDDREPFLNTYMSALARQESFSGEFRMLDRHGAYRWLLVRCPARFRPGPDGAKGTFAGYISSAIDITDRKRAEEALQASEARLRSVIANAPVAMTLLLGRDLVIALHNQTFIDIVGKGPNIAGKPLREIMPELTTENQPFLQILDDVYTSGRLFQTYSSQVKVLRDGVMTDNYYNITYTPLRDAGGEVYGILGIGIDVTEQVLARQKLEESGSRYRQLAAELEERVKHRTRDLERSNLDLMQFASVASHRVLLATGQRITLRIFDLTSGPLQWA